MPNKIIDCTLTWFKSCFLLALLAILGIATNIQVPLWLIPLLFYIAGLLLAISQIKDQNQSAMHPTDRAQRCVDRNKSVEEIDWSSPLVIWFSGKGFPSDFRRPFDERVYAAMSRCAADALQYFGAVTSYTHGRKIYLLFASSQKPLIKLRRATNKKVQVISSISSYISSRFYMHINREKFEENESELKESLKNNMCVQFVGNGFNFPNDYEVLNFFISVSQGECFKEAVNKLALRHYVPAEILDISAYKLVGKLRNERKVDFNKLPKQVKYGTFIKRAICDSGESKKEEENIDKDSISEKPIRMLMNNVQLEFKEEYLDFLFAKDLKE